MAAVLNAHADNELREKEFLPIFSAVIAYQSFFSRNGFPIG